MNRSYRLQNRGIRTVLDAVLIARLTARAAEAQLVPLMSRVRTDDASMAVMIQEATESSATFRRLVDTIDASDASSTSIGAAVDTVPLTRIICHSGDPDHVSLGP